MSSEFANLQFPLKLQKLQQPLINIGKKSQKQILREDLQKYHTAYLFSYKDVRKYILNNVVDFAQWRGSKLWFGKNKIIHGALQNLSLFNIYWPDVEKFSKAVKGEMGILFTNRKEKNVRNWFNSFSVWDYPYPGYEVDVTIRLRKGPLPQFQPAIEPYLRKLGMPTNLVNGTVELTEDFEVCRAGTILTSEQVHFLELLGEKLSVFKLRLVAKWTKEKGFCVLDKLEEFEEEEELDSEHE